MTRVIKPVSLSIELNEIAERNIKNFSEYVQECIKRDFSKENLERMNAEDMKKIEERKKIINELSKDDGITEEDLSIKEKNFIFETKQIIQKDPQFLEGRWRKYKNDFIKNISLSKFKELLSLQE